MKREESGAVTRTRIVLVDDEPDLVRALTDNIAQHRPEWIVESFTDSVRALEHMRRSPPTVLVTDLRMPEMSGLELMLALRSTSRRLPVVVMTGFGSPDIEDELRRSGLVRYLRKPFKVAALIEAIEASLEAPKGFSGTISVSMLPDVIQLYALARVSGALYITTPEGERSAVWFEEGEVLHAESGDAEGDEGFYRLIGHENGSFSMDSIARATRRTITSSWQSLMMEGVRRIDEDRRAELHGGAAGSTVGAQAAPGSGSGTARVDGADARVEDHAAAIGALAEAIKRDAPSAIALVAVAPGGEAHIVRGHAIVTEESEAIMAAVDALIHDLAGVVGEEGGRLDCLASGMAINLAWRRSGGSLVCADLIRHSGDEAIFGWKATGWSEAWFAGREGHGADA